MAINAVLIFQGRRQGDVLGVQTPPEIPKINVIWKVKCSKIPLAERPTSAVLSLSLCNRDFFPNLHFLLKVLATLPVSTATAERTFSTLKRLKTFLRNATGQDRLTGLALMSVHRDIVIDPQQVITELARQPRRLSFVI